MSLWNSLRTAVLGVDLDEEQRRADALDAQAVAMGLRSQPVDVYAEVGGAFDEGLAEGAARLRRGGDAIIGGTLGTLFKSVPVFVWLGLAVFVAYKLGAFRKLLKA